MKDYSSNLEFVAAKGELTNPACILTPIFKKGENQYIDLENNHILTRSRLDSMFNRGMCLYFNPLIMPNYSQKYRGNQTNPTKNFPGFQFLFFSNSLVKNVGEEFFDSLVSRCKGEPAKLSEDSIKNLSSDFSNDDYFFIFDKRYFLGGFVPNFIDFCASKIDKQLSERRKKAHPMARCLIWGEKDPLAQLARTMMIISLEDTIKKPINYYLKTLLLGPNYIVSNPLFKIESTGSK